MRDLIQLVEELRPRLRNGDGLVLSDRNIRTDRVDIVETMRFLKEAFDDVRLMDICAVEYKDSFEVVYRLLERDTQSRPEVEILTVKVDLTKTEAGLPSILEVWKSADVLEREVWDLMGIEFSGRGPLKRVLCMDDFEGHPLRKDFMVASAERFSSKGESEAGR
jgi:NADH-quinone oxidoreductase subunit C